MVAAPYRLVVGVPLSWPNRPGDGDSIWSTETHWPGDVVILILLLELEVGLVRHGRLVALPKRHPEHFGTRQSISRLGRCPLAAMRRIEENGRCDS